MPFTAAVESPDETRRAQGTQQPQTLGDIRGPEVTPDESEIYYEDTGTVLQIEDQEAPGDALQTTAGQITAVDPLGGYPLTSTLEDPGDATDVEDPTTDDELPKPPEQLTEGDATDVEDAEEEPQPQEGEPQSQEPQEPQTRHHWEWHAEFSTQRPRAKAHRSVSQNRHQFRTRARVGSHQNGCGR